MITRDLFRGKNQGWEYRDSLSNNVFILHTVNPELFPGFTYSYQSNARNDPGS